MTTQPFDADAYWRDRERNDEWWNDADDNGDHHTGLSPRPLVAVLICVAAYLVLAGVVVVFAPVPTSSHNPNPTHTEETRK